MIIVSDRYLTGSHLYVSTPAVRPTTSGSSTSHHRRRAIRSISSSVYFLPGSTLLPPECGYPQRQAGAEAVPLQPSRNAGRKLRGPLKIVVVVQVLAVRSEVTRQGVSQLHVSAVRL